MVDVEAFENLVGVLTQDLCIRIFSTADRLMGILEDYGVAVEYSDGPGELFAGNSYGISREEGELEEYENGTPAEEYTYQRDYYVDLERGVACESWSGSSDRDWVIPPWIMSMIRQHNTFYMRVSGPANAVVDHLGEGEVAVKYLHGDEWGYEVFKDGRSIRKLPKGYSG
jgi:hypothetical protein